jgi:hypothetical protein
MHLTMVHDAISVLPSGDTCRAANNAHNIRKRCGE